MNAPRTGGDWLQSFTGRKVYPLDLRAEDIDLADIAHALAHQCRFAGHCRSFYSVAQHSVLVAEYLGALAGEMALSRMGLLHDASEAYLTDIPRPLKRHPDFAFYREAEDRAEAVIAARFGLSTHPEDLAMVKHADAVLLATEARDLMSPLHPEWHHQESNGYEVLRKVIVPESPREAEAAFLAMAARLGVK